VITNRESLVSTPAHDIALACVEAGIEAAHPKAVLAETVSYEDEHLTVDEQTYDLREYDEVIVLGGGNIAGQVAVALEEVLGNRISNGVVVTDDPTDTTHVQVLEGDHPLPSTRGTDGAERVLECAEAADESTLLLAVIGGGGSALLPAPTGDVSLGDLRAVTDDLLASGASIHEINAVRKHLSDIKGGRLAAAAAPATVVGLVFSDVVGNDLDVIASGPIAPDSSTFADARDVLRRYDVATPETVDQHLKRGMCGKLDETPTAGSHVFDRVETHILADGMTALTAARDTARASGYETAILSSRVQGEARDAAAFHAAIIEQIHSTGDPVEPPVILFSGGETTVTLTGDGAGGPNQEFALQSALELPESSVVASVDTDGIDGATEVAGAIVDASTCAGTEAKARNALANNDTYSYLQSAGALIETGPTGTNVNDLRVIVIDD
jgi:hydroxypyruvate reductase